MSGRDFFHTLCVCVALIFIGWYLGYEGQLEDITQSCIDHLGFSGPNGSFFRCDMLEPMQ